MKILFVAALSFLLGAAAMYAMSMKLVATMSQYTAETRLDFAVTAVEWLETGGVPVAKGVLLREICAQRAYLETSLGEAFWQESGYTNKVLQRSDAFTGQCAAMLEER